jgi:hypothetical protein
MPPGWPEDLAAALNYCWVSLDSSSKPAAVPVVPPLTTAGRRPVLRQEDCAINGLPGPTALARSRWRCAAAVFAFGALATRGAFESALCFLEEATVDLADACPVVRCRNCWRHGMSADRALQDSLERRQMKRGCKGARRRSAAGQSGRKRPTRAPDSDAAHPLLAQQRVALARSPNFNATESSLPNADARANGRTT